MITRLRFQLLVLVLRQSSFLQPLLVLSIIAESSGRFAFWLYGTQSSSGSPPLPSAFALGSGHPLDVAELPVYLITLA